MDKLKAIRRMIILCWMSLTACCIIKLMGGNYFQIFSENERVISICNYIESAPLIKYSIYLILNIVNNLIYLLAVCQLRKFSLKQIIILSLIFIVFYAIKMVHQIGGFIVDGLTYLVIPFILLEEKKKLYRLPIGMILDISFQFISVYTKDLNISEAVSNNFLIALIFMIDYYIMLILFYLYSREKYIEKERRRT